ncbi:MAG: response regulator [Euzebya sp.]
MRMHNPSLIVLDIKMPDVGGLRVLDELAEEHSEATVIVVTGKPDAVQEARQRLGAEKMFDKLFDVDELLQRVTQILET